VIDKEILFETLVIKKKYYYVIRYVDVRFKTTVVHFLSATCYRNAKALPEAREAYVKAAEMQQRMRSYPLNLLCISSLMRR